MLKCIVIKCAGLRTTFRIRFERAGSRFEICWATHVRKSSHTMHRHKSLRLTRFRLRVSGSVEPKVFQFDSLMCWLRNLCLWCYLGGLSLGIAGSVASGFHWVWVSSLLISQNSFNMMRSQDSVSVWPHVFWQSECQVFWPTNNLALGTTLKWIESQEFRPCRASGFQTEKSQVRWLWVVSSKTLLTRWGLRTTGSV